MKFTEEEAYNELVSKMTNSGKSPLQANERTLKAMLKRDYSLFVNEETELTDFITSNLPVYNEYNQEARSVNSDYIKAQGLVKSKVEKPIKKPEENPNTDLETLKAEMDEIKQALEASKREKAIIQKKSDLLSKMKELGIKDNKWSEKMVSKLSITDDLDIEAEANDYLGIYNDFIANVKPTNTPGQSNAGNNTTNAEFEMIRKLREKDLEQQKKI